MNQLLKHNTNTPLLAHRLNKEENISLNQLMNIKEQYRLNQRKNQLYMSLMEKRTALLSIEGGSNTKVTTSTITNTHNDNKVYMAQYTNANDKLGFISNILNNNEEINAIEYGISLLTSLLPDKLLMNTLIIQLPLNIIYITNRLICLLIYNQQIHIELSNHYAFKCSILHLLINLSCDYDIVMNQLIQGNKARLIFEYYNSTLTNNANDVKEQSMHLMIQNFLLLFSNMITEENTYMELRQSVDISVTIRNTIGLVGNKNFNMTMSIGYKNNLYINFVILIYNWLKYSDLNSQVKENETIVLFIMKLFLIEILNQDIIKDSLITELYNVLLLLSNRSDCIYLFHTSNVSIQLIRLLLTKDKHYAITSYKIISNLLCVKSLESQALLLQGGLFEFIYNQIASVNTQQSNQVNQSQDQYDNDFVLYSCQCISNMILTDEPCVLNYLLDLHIIQSLKLIILNYKPNNQLEALYVLYYSSLVQNSQLNSLLYKENMHLFLINELKSLRPKEVEYALVVLKIIEQMLVYGNSINKSNERKGRMNYIKIECEDNGFDLILDKLQYNSNADITDKAKTLLETYWHIEDDDSDILGISIGSTQAYLSQCLFK